MTDPTNRSGNVLASMWMSSAFLADLIALNSPDEMARHLCEQLRELTGARTVAYFQQTDHHGTCSPLYVCPPRRAALFSDGKLAELCPGCHPAALPTHPQELPENDLLRNQLETAQIQNLQRIPIRCGGALIGSFLIANLPSPERSGEIHSMMEFLGPAIGLAIENCVARQKIQEQRDSLEDQVKIRTAELETANQELNASREAALNMMEDAVLAKNHVYESRKNLEITLNSIGDGVISTDTHGRITIMNPVAETLTGWPRTEALGKPLETVFRIIDADTHRPIETPFSDVLDGSKLVGQDKNSLLISKNGTKAPIADSSTPILNEAGDITGIALVFRDQTEEKLAEHLTQIRLELIAYSDTHTLEELVTKAIDVSCELLGSTIGFYHFVDTAANTISLQQWSTRTLREFCQVEQLVSHYNINDAGVWADCIRQKKPLLHNNFQALPHKKGMPEGHAALERELVVPVIRNGTAVAVLGVANKSSDYNQRDAETAGFLSDIVWEIYGRKKAAESLKDSEARLRRAQDVAQIGDWQIEIDTGKMTVHERVSDLYGIDFYKTDLEEVKRHTLSEYRSMLDQAMEDLIHHEKPYDVEYRIRRPSDGQFVDIHSVAEYDPGSRTVFGVMQDITTRKQSEQALERSEAKYRLLFEQSADAYLMIKEGRFVDCNSAAIEMLGFPTKELLLNRHPAELSPLMQPDGQNSRKKAEAIFQRMNQERSLRFEWAHQRANGEVFPVEVSLTAITDNEGERVVHTTWRDISNRKVAEAKIADLARFPEENSNPVLRISFDNILLYANPASEILLPCLEAQLGSAVNAVWQQHIQQALASKHPLEIEIETASRIFAVSLVPVIEHRYVNIYARDISERKRLQEAVEQRIIALTRPLEDSAEIEFEELFNIHEIQRLQDEFSNATGTAAIIVRPDGTPITEASNFTDLCSLIRTTEKGCANCRKSDQAIGRYHPGEPLVQPCLSGGLWDAGSNITVGGKHIASWLIGQVRDEIQDEEQICAYAREIGVNESAMLKAYAKVPGMSRSHFNDIAQVLFTLANQLSNTAYQNIQQARFISEQKTAAAELLRLSTAIEQSPETIVITDPNGIIQYANPAFETITGYTVEEAQGKNPSVLKSGEHPDDFYAAMWQTISNGGIWEGHLINKRKDGSLFTEEASISPVKATDGSIVNYVAVKRDISKELVKEEELRQAQKMEAVGQLAGGVAHDFNNILQGILGFSEMLRFGLDKNSNAYAQADEIHNAAHRAAALTRQLLTFSRKEPVQQTEVDLNDVIQDSEALLTVLLNEKHHLILNLQDDLPPIHADPSQLTQVIMNLAVNARDAMPDGGRLSIASESIMINKTDAAYVSGTRPGRYLCLVVTDTGHGMDDQTKARIFEPFFTTKEIGSGTGLGLSVIYGIVEQNNGWISVFSEIGKGTSFNVYLPVPAS